MNNENFNKKYKVDHTGAFADAFFIGNLLFVGVFFVFLWILYFTSYKDASQASKNHLKQALLASSITTLIVIIMNVYILMTTGYASVTALLSAEIYLMLVLPIFLVLGVFAFTKAVNDNDFRFPIIGNLLGIKVTN